MDGFSSPTRTWFERTFATPTPIQARGWEAIRAGRHALLVAPTGSGKTLAAFLWALDRVCAQSPDERDSGAVESARRGTQVVYISPLKALAYDVERNLRTPLVGIRRAAEQLGVAIRDVRVDVRTGDTSQQERRRQLREPGDVLVTTPESLFLMLGSSARESLRSVHTVIVDEVHALAPTKRGVHLALSLERLGALVADAVSSAGDRHRPQRIGLSATARPTDEVAHFLAGGDRPVDVVDASTPPQLDLTVVSTPSEPPPEAGDDASAVAADETSVLGELYTASPIRGAARDVAASGAWAGIYAEVLAAIRSHRSTIVFVNSRSVCERIATNLNDRAGEELVSAHHGSVSQDRRREIEEALKRGDVRGIVATSSLELGVDMGAVDLVILIGSPGTVASGLQRVGRAGHHVDATSRGVIYPKFTGDLLELAVLSSRMRAAELEPIRVPSNCLDVLAQQLVAIVCDGDREVDELERLVKSAYPYRALPRALLVGVLDMLSGRYPSDDFADLRPRLSWDRARDVLKARRGAAMLSRLNAGTIPDRGQFHVYLGDGGPRVGELDEELVYELRNGEVILLGTSSWRVLEVTRDRVLVEPAPGEAGRLPFWRGEGPGRSVELGWAIGALLRELGSCDDRDAMAAVVGEATPLDRAAARQLAGHVFDQREHLGGVLPTDRTLVVERFRDELGDWRVCILSPFGGRVHAPWAMALQSTLSARAGFEVVVTYNDDGLVLTFADADELPGVDVLFPDPDELEDLVADQLDGSALFGAGFRENAARALLLPKRNPRSRSPLWAQRLKAKNLLAAVMKHADFPIVLETYRQCLRDQFDLPSLAELLVAVRDRSIHVECVETPRASPFASSLVFAHVATYLYERDAPLAERRTHALTLDRSLLRELLGDTSVRDLVDLDVLHVLEGELQRSVESRRARNADELHDLLRWLGALDVDALARRAVDPPDAWLAELAGERRAVEVRIREATRWIAAQDAGLYRDALGIALPPGLPSEFVAPVEDALVQLVRRDARSRGPFLAVELAARLGVAAAAVEPLLHGLETDGVLVRGALRPGGTSEQEWCDADVLRQLKRRTLAKLRGEIAPVDAAALTRFLFDWQGIGAKRRDPSVRVLEVVAQLEGLALPWSEWESAVLPARVDEFGSDVLDLLSATGQIVWIGRGSLGEADGRVALYRREAIGSLVRPAALDESTAVHDAILDELGRNGATFTFVLEKAVAARCPDADAATITAALWDLAWSGQLTNDTFAPLRGLGGSRFRKGRRGGVGRARMAAANAGMTGRWSLVRELAAADVTATERAHATATALLERYGVVSRSAAAAEELRGGFAAVYDVLTGMEDAGRVRRGMFVDGLDGAQFALPGAVDRLRAGRERDDSGATALVLPAVDPANPWGALVPWPETSRAASRPRRAAGARVVFVDGQLVLWAAPNRRRLLTFASAADGECLTRALQALAESAQRRLFVLESIDGLAPEDSPHRAALEQSGFTRDYRGWILSTSRRA